MYCQLDYICGLVPARIRHALAELPETLDETYKRTLRGINKAEWEYAHRLFQLVAVASRPLRVEELADLLAFDFEAGPIPKFYEDWRLEDPVDGVLSTCSSLLSVVDGGHLPEIHLQHAFGKVIQFSHFSVKEFLMSARLAGTNDIILRHYHISTAPAHTLAAQACLGILLHLDKDVVTRDSLKESPFAKYAAEHWADHSRLEDVLPNVEEGMKQLFDPIKSHLTVCIWIHNPACNRKKRDPQSERPLLPRKTPLHYAALWGLHSIVEFLVTEHQQDVNSRDFTPDNITPLHLALEKGHLKVTRVLLDRGADLTARDERGLTPFHLAIQNGHAKVVRFLLERGADVTPQVNGGLHLALRSGQVEVAVMLIEHGADLDAKSKSGLTPLNLAIKYRQMKVVSMLIELGADVTIQTEYDWQPLTPLHQASQVGLVEIAAMLIDHGADVTVRDKDGNAPLHLALSWKEAEVAVMLIERGADVTARKENGTTPLHLALGNGHAEVAVMLIERGADVTARDENGTTPLHLALSNEQVEVAVMLIERGADVTARDEDGTTLLHLALSNEQVEVAVMLIEHGVDLNARNEYGSTPLHLAVACKQVEVVATLLECGADVTAKNKGGWTPLHLASKNGQVEVVGMLIEHSADVAAQNEDGTTPLHLALGNGQAEVAFMLIERGADTTPHKYGWTPLHLASLIGQVELASMLIGHGADVTARYNDGLTPLHLAANETARFNDGLISLPPHLVSVAKGGHVEVIGTLIENGADVTAQNNDDLTPLHLVLQEGRLEVADRIIERYAGIWELARSTLFLSWPLLQNANLCHDCVLRSEASRTPEPLTHRLSP